MLNKIHNKICMLKRVETSCEEEGEVKKTGKVYLLLSLSLDFKLPTRPSRETTHFLSRVRKKKKKKGGGVRCRGAPATSRRNPIRTHDTAGPLPRYIFQVRIPPRCECYSLSLEFVLRIISCAKCIF